MKQSKFGVASLIFGIAGLLLSCIIVGIIPSIIGLSLAIIGMDRKGSKKGTAIIGLSCSLIGIVMSIIILVCICVSPTKENDRVTEKIEKSDEIIEDEKVINEEQNKENKVSEKSNEPKEENSNKNEDKFLTDLKNVLDKKVAKKAYKILKNKIGFSDMKFEKQLGETSNYEISADGYDIVLTASDDVYRIFIPDTSYTLYENGKVKMKVSDLNDKKISQTEMNSYYFMAQEIIKSNLKNPGSAHFPSIITRKEDIVMNKDGNIVEVQSYVDAKNSFGAKIRSKWLVEFEVLDLENYSYEVMYINIDGIESGKYKEIE